jgi:hypothetical protein
LCHTKESEREKNMARRVREEDFLKFKLNCDLKKIIHEEELKKCKEVRKKGEREKERRKTKLKSIKSTSKC